MDDFEMLEAARAKVASLKQELAAIEAAPLPAAEIERRVDSVLDAACTGIPRPVEELSWFTRRDGDPLDGGTIALRLLNKAQAALSISMNRDAIKSRLLDQISGIVSNTKAALGSDVDFDAERQALLLGSIKAVEVREEQIFRRLRIVSPFLQPRQDISAEIRQASDEDLATIAATMPVPSVFDSDEMAATDASGAGTETGSSSNA